MNYLETNKASWNQRVEPHLDSDFYDMKSFMKGKSSLNSIELDVLGTVRGKSILHLQCHFGQDTMSFSRMGAKSVGVDFSDKAIDTANEIKQSLNLDTRFICSDIYSLDNSVLNETFDIVFTSYGTIGWLPDLDKWASIVNHYLKPGGKFVIAEFHPAVWMFDDDLNEVKYSYFNREQIEEEEEGSYTDKSEHLRTKFITWNHSLGEVYNALKNTGLHNDFFQEYDYSPYPCFTNSVEQKEGQFMIKNFEEKLPLVYCMSWVK